MTDSDVCQLSVMEVLMIVSMMKHHHRRLWCPTFTRGHPVQQRSTSQCQHCGPVFRSEPPAQCTCSPSLLPIDASYAHILWWFLQVHH